MKLDLNKESEKALFYLNKYIKQGKIIELRAIRKPKTIQQLKYIHALFKIFSIESHFQYSKEEVKTICKVVTGLVYKKDNYDFTRSLADLDSKEMTDVIETFRTWASKEAGIYLPSPDEYLSNYYDYERDFEINKQYLT